MINKNKVLKSISLGLFVLALLGVRPVMAESPIPEKLYYDHALSAYAQVFSYSNPQHMSHPPYYTAEVRPIEGPYGLEYAIRTHSTGFYGLNPVTITLFLQSGLMQIQAEVGMPPTLREVTLNPPDQRFSDYLQYRARLSRMRADLDFLAGDGKPELAQVIAYVDAVDREVSQLSDVLGAEIPFEIRPGQTYSIPVTCKTAGPRDVLVDFLDGQSWYTGTRISLGQQGEAVTASVSITLPREIAEPKTAYLSVKLVPAGQPWQARLFEKDQTAQVLPAEEIIYFWETYLYTKK